ncbi:kinase-like domain-containing protein [Phycomyces nitens]|nr:kinase-like domain-containing protein [Phycomyces nitens]
MGSFATLKKEQLEDQVVAVKTYTRYHGHLVRRHCERELRAVEHLGLRSPESLKYYLMHVMNVVTTDQIISLTMPFYEHTLASVKLSLTEARRVVYQMATALSYIHAQGMVHCDVSPSNVLVNGAGQCALSDFGCAHLKKFMPDPMEVDEIGTRYYKAPEHLFGYRVYRPSTDIWSLGTLFCQLLIGYPLFAGENDLEQIGSIVRRLGSPNESEREEMKCCPDATKLMFFMPAECDSEDSEDESEDEDDSPDTMTLEMAMENHSIEERDRDLLRKMLTWSMKTRSAVKEIIDLDVPENDWIT